MALLVPLWEFRLRASKGTVQALNVLRTAVPLAILFAVSLVRLGLQASVFLWSNSSGVSQRVHRSLDQIVFKVPAAFRQQTFTTRQGDVH